ncbi:origin recognition complex subunit 4-like [Mytilus californianus]|uniref:origin recognition complex subunit 4-like n=1 Tax=Mytilus californianus TaxID=6549 RepID=UPI002247D65E|nr:origin recognition complex subunit 4-like [Mytilus californianus]
MKSSRRKSKTTKETDSGETTSLQNVQDELRLRFSQNALSPALHGYEKERRQLFDLIKRTASTGESNSVLVIGPRGSGKTMTLNSIYNELIEDDNIRENLLQVKLNGLLQTDDKIALKEITRQLQLENTLGDKVFGSFAETLQFLLDALKCGSQSSKPILFILEEFDMFAHHKNQTLLYNLFDIAQSDQAPICVVGVTCRLDVIELLEKRVKSRFSHRQVYFLNNYNFENYCDICMSYLRIESKPVGSDFIKEWNKQVEKLSKDGTVRDVLQQQFNFNKDIRALHHILMYVVCHLNETHSFPTPSDFVEAMKVTMTDSKSAMLHGISILELCLIIAMKHLTDIYDGEPFNFEMVYSEYAKFAQKRSSMQMYEKAVVLKAFEHLLALELVKSTDGSGTRIQKEYRLMSLLIHPSQITDALQKYPQCPTEVKQWASTSVI